MNVDDTLIQRGVRYGNYKEDVSRVSQALKEVVRSGAHSSITHGYTTGGSIPPTPSDAITNQIQKFPFQAVFTTASDIGDLIATKKDAHGSSSSEHGYTTGGGTNPTTNQRIERFPFSYDSSSVDVGDITEIMEEGGSGSSKTHGYVVGSYGAPASVNKSDILKFGFASQSNTNNIGDLISSIYRNAGQSSTTHGYSSGGFNQNPGGAPAPTSVNVIEKYSFVTDGNGVDSGDLSVSRRSAAGQQD